MTSLSTMSPKSRLYNSMNLLMPVSGPTVKKISLCALTFCLCPAVFAASVITTRPDDPGAVYLDPPAANNDGTDSSAPLQTAIDKAGSSAREGIVFIPAGRYTLTRTIYVWPGVRLIGYGASRPVFILAAQHPRLSKGNGRHGHVHRPRSARRPACRPDPSPSRRPAPFRLTSTSPTPIRTPSTRR